jgi:uncharacterized protein YbjT (DUF2867 family)
LVASNYHKLIVFGGTGHYGRRIVRALADRGVDVRVVSRNAQRARLVLPGGVEIFEGDVTVRDTISTAVRGADAVLLALSAAHWSTFRKRWEIEHDAVLDILKEAKQNSIRRLVYLSGYDMREQVLQDLGIPDFGAIMEDVEDHIHRSGLNWTILGCAPSFELFFALIKKGKMMVPGGGYNPIPAISPFDVGQIAAQAVLRNDLGSRRLRLTGPMAYSFPQVAALVSRLSGTAMQHRAIPLSVVRSVSSILSPAFPYVRFIYESLLLLNNFPRDLAERVPEDHRILTKLFEYQPVSLESEVLQRMNNQGI